MIENHWAILIIVVIAAIVREWSNQNIIRKLRARLYATLDDRKRNTMSRMQLNGPRSMAAIYAELDESRRKLEGESDISFTGTIKPCKRFAPILNPEWLAKRYSAEPAERIIVKD